MFVICFLRDLLKFVNVQPTGIMAKPAQKMRPAARIHFEHRRGEAGRNSYPTASALVAMPGNDTRFWEAAFDLEARLSMSGL